MDSAMLAGREREIAVLARLLEGTPLSGAVLLMLGDPGIGKSSLLNEAESRGGPGASGYFGWSVSSARRRFPSRDCTSWSVRCSIRSRCFRGTRGKRCWRRSDWWRVRLRSRS